MDKMIKFPHCYGSEVIKQFEWLSHDEKCGVLIIGGGVAACLAAYKLAKEGEDIVLVTKNPIGFGDCEKELAASCSAASVGGGGEMLTGLSKSVGRENAVAFYNQTLSALDTLELLNEELTPFGFTRRDSFIYTDKAEDINAVHSEYLMRRHNGFDVMFLEQSDARELFSFPVKAGILMKDSAGEADIYRLCHSLLESAAENGARIYENTSICDLLDYQSGVTAQTTMGQSIEAKKLILATSNKQDEYLDALSGRRKSFFISTAPLMSFSGYESRAIVNNLSKDISLRTTADDRVIISGLSCPVLDGSGKIAKLFPGERISNRKYAELGEALLRMLCGIDMMKGEHCGAGTYGITKDGLPVFGTKSGYNNTYFFMPASRENLLLSVIGADVITEQQLNGTVNLLFSPNRKTLQK